MKITILVVVFVVAASGMSEATDPMINYYNEIYSNDLAYKALLSGIMLNMLLGL